MRRVTILPLLLYATASFPALAQQASTGTAAATAAQPTEEMGEEEEPQEIVVQGQRPRGSVVGDIPAENVLTTRDIRATGATSISELLDAVATQTGSVRGRSGGRPILLLNGQRISSFRELRDLPPEAIERMEILPEEVALKYGYTADQRVVNIVLRRRFNSTNVELRGRGATDGGTVSGQAEAGRLLIADGTRTSISFHADGNSPLYEDERDIAREVAGGDDAATDERGFRTLVGPANALRLTATHNRTIFGDVSATLNGEVERTANTSRNGLRTGTIDDALRRNSNTETYSLGSALNWQKGKWRFSSTGNGEYSHGTSWSDNDVALPSAIATDRSRSNRYSLALDGTATGPLFELPAGDATATFKIGAGSTGIDSRSLRDGFGAAADLHRNSLTGTANLDLPITKRASSIGRLTANANASVTTLSDFGTLTSIGAGLNWAPTPRLNLNASWTREEGAPSLQQLGDPLVATTGVRVFDFKTGQTVEVTMLNGGNPGLDADTRNVFKIAGNWRPFEKHDLRLRAEFVHQTIDDPQAGITISEAIEQAFPLRFERDGSGLVLVDLRPVNFRQSRRDTVRWGFEFTKPLASKPPSSQAISAFRERFARNRAATGNVTPPAAEGRSPPENRGQGAEAAGGERGGERGGGPGGFRFGGGGGPGGRQGGRLTFSLTHQINLVDEVTIADGVPKLDYLNGEPVGQSGGRPRHEVQFESGYYNNGYGARLQGNWRSATRVDSSSGDLRFSPYFDLDLRLFANLGENFELVSKHPFFRGASIRFDVENVLNTRPKVRDATGATPFSYQSDFIEPVGRTFGITFRKLFVPRRFFQQQRRGPSGG